MVSSSKKVPFRLHSARASLAGRVVVNAKVRDDGGRAPPGSRACSPGAGRGVGAASVLQGHHGYGRLPAEGGAIGRGEGGRREGAGHRRGVQKLRTSITTWGCPTRWPRSTSAQRRDPTWGASPRSIAGPDRTCTICRGRSPSRSRSACWKASGADGGALTVVAPLEYDGTGGAVCSASS